MFELRFTLSTRRGPAAGDCEADRRAVVGREASSAARRHGVGQDVHRRQRHQERGQTDARHFAQQDARRPALRPNSKVFFRRMPSNTSSATSTYYQRKPTSRAPTRSLRRIRAGTRKSTRPAAFRDEFAVLAPGRDRGRQRVVHLRHRQQGGLPRPWSSRFARGWNYRANNSSRASWTALRRNDIEFTRGQFRVRGAPWNFVPPGAKTGCAWNFLARKSSASTRFRAAEPETKLKRSTPSPFSRPNNSSPPATR